MAAIRFTDPEVFHKVAKYILVLIHSMFLVVGIAVTGFSTFALVEWHDDAAAFLAHQNLPNFAAGGLVVGIVLVVLSCFGVLAGLTENRCMLVVNSLCLILVTVLFACLGASVFIIKDHLETDVALQSGNLWSDFQASWIQAARTDQAAVCAVQLALKCTGFASGARYALHRSKAAA